MSDEGNEIQIIHGKGDPLEQSFGRVNSVVTNSLILGTPKASFQSPTKELAAELKEKLKETKTNGKIEVYLGHSPFFRELKRLFHRDRRANFFLRMGLGLPSILKGSLIQNKLMRSDHYNPLTETVHVYHPNKAVALHEIGHALDFDKAKYPGLKTFGGILPPIRLKQEWVASRNAMKYLDKKEQHEASKILEPAFSSYVGSFGGLAVGKLISAPAALVTYIGSIALGHLHSRTSEKNIFYNGEPVLLKEDSKEQKTEISAPAFASAATTV